MSETVQAKATHASPQQSELPSGWRWVRLKEVTSVVNGTTPDSENPCFWNGDIVWITPTDLGKLVEPYIRNSDRRITKAGFDSRNLTRVPSRSVVLSSRAPIGHLGIAAVELCTNQGCKSFIPNDDTHEWFLYYALKRSVWKLQQLGSGATFAEISKTQLENFIIPLPPIEEQRRIVGVLREQMEAVEKARTAAQARLAAVKALPAAFLRQVFPQPGQPLPDGWRWVRLGEIASHGPDNGIFKRRGDFGRGVAIVNVSDLYRSLHVDLSLTERVCVTADELKRYEIVPGDLFFCRSSLKREGIGWCCVIKEMEEPAVFECHVMRVRLKLTDAIPEHVARYWQHPAVREKVIGNSRTATMTTMNQQDLSGVMIPLPPLPEQRRMAGVLKEQMAAGEKARAAAEEELATINALPAALVRRAFSGDL